MDSRPWSEPALRPQLLLTGMMVLLAAVACHLMLVQMHLADAASALAALAVLLVAVLIRLRLGASRRTGDVLIVAGFVLALVPLPLAGVTTEAGLAFRVLAGLRNVALVALVFASQQRTMRMAAQASTALVLFSFALANGWELLVVAVLFAGVGVAWMVMSSWRAFAEQIPQAVAARTAPWSWALLLGLMGGFCFLAGVLLYPTRAQGLLQEYVNQDVSDEALEKARALARQPGNQQTLREMAEMKYGATAGGGSGATGLEGLNDEKRKIKEFPLVRQGLDAPSAWKERVLFQSKERGAGHLPILTYGQLDGNVWREEHASRKAMVAADIAPDRSWKTVLEGLRFDLDPDAQEPDESRAEDGDAVAWSRRALSKLSAALEGGGRVVSPQRTPLNRRKLLEMLSQPAGRVHPDLLLTPYDQKVIQRQLLREYGPEGIERFKSSEDFRRDVLNEYVARWRQDPGAALPDDLRALVKSWVGDRPRGWAQIEAIIQGLRRHAHYDPEATVPADQPDPIHYFLMKSRRGPDYLFASAATVLLRHLGYPSRLVAGFYVRPGDYRLLTGTTPVTAGDIHYWAQVHAPPSLWVNLEPTPGYEPTRPAYSFSERLTQTLDEARPLWPPVAAGVVLVAALVVLRRRLAERLATLWWRLRSGQPTGRLVRATWRLIDRRARVAGHQRQPGMTLASWSAVVETGNPVLGAPLATLAETANWITHAPPSALPRLGRSEGEIRTLCRGAVRGCTVRALRRALSHSHPHPGGRHGNRDR